MRWVVRPAVAVAGVNSVAAVDVRPIATVDIGVAVKVVVHVDVDIAVSPAATITPTASPGRADRKSHTEPDEGSAWDVWRVINRGIWIGRWAVDNDRIVRGHINRLRAWLLYDDYLLALDSLGLDRHLFVGLQSSLVLRLVAHSLNSIHHVGLLGQKRIAQIGCPLNVVGEPFGYVSEPRHRLNTGVPGLLGGGISQRLVLQVGVFRQPLLELHQLQRIG
jgi:hypothetical protein